MMWKLSNGRTLTDSSDLELFLSICYLVFLGNLSSRYCPLAVDPFPLNGMRVLHVHDIFEGIDTAICHESKASGFPSSLILQYGAILDIAILDKVLFELFVTQVVREAPNEYLPELGIQLWRYLLLVYHYWLLPLLL